MEQNFIISMKKGFLKIVEFIKKLRDEIQEKNNDEIIENEL